MLDSPAMSNKNAGLRIRVERELREAFQGACAAENRRASEVLREFMQSFVERHQGGLQADLFAGESDNASTIQYKRR